MEAICKVEEKDLAYAIEKIDYWYKKDLRYLTIVTVPFNTSCIFKRIIHQLAENKEKILYVWGLKKENKELTTAIKDSNPDIKCSYIEKGKSDSDLTFIHYKNIRNIKNEYKLIIFDDVTYFSQLSIEEVRKIIDICAEIGERILLYSIEKIALIGEKFEFAAYNYNQPFLEPRVLTTRIDLNKDIPYTLYDYLIWFKSNKHRVSICVPSKNNIDDVYDYFNNKLKLDDVKIIKASNENEIKKYEDVLKYNKKAIFIITNQIKELLQCCTINDAVVLFADDSIYNYKKIIYMCGYLRKLNTSASEVLLVSNTISEEIEKTKSMAREFNKKVWEKKLRKL